MEKEEYCKIHSCWYFNIFNGIFNVCCPYISNTKCIGGDLYVPYNLA